MSKYWSWLKGRRHDHDDDDDDDDNGGGNNPPPAPPPPPGRPGEASVFDWFTRQTPLNDPNASRQGGPRTRIWDITPTILGWEHEVWDLRGGLGVTEGDTDTDWDNVLDSTGNTVYYRRFTNNFLVTAATSPDPSGDLAGLHSVNCFSTLVMATGSGANVALVKESGATDPTVEAMTYDPGTGIEISCLHRLTIGGVSEGDRIVVGRIGAAAQILGDAADTPTVDATMDSSVNTLWGLAQTPLNNMRAILYIDNSFYYLDVDDTATTAPTQIDTDLTIPSGGCCLGIMALGEGPVRIWWLIPREDTPAGALLTGAPCDVYSTDLEGEDLQILDMGLDAGVKTAALILPRSSIIATDGTRTMLHTGQGRFDTFQFAGRDLDSDYEYRCRGFGVRGPDVYALVNKIDATGQSEATIEWVEYLDIDTGRWHKRSAETTLTSDGVQGILPSGSLPISLQNNFMHWYSDGSWRRIFTETHAYDPFDTYRKTTANNGAAQEFAASAEATSPVMELRNERQSLAGMPKVVAEIQFRGDLNAGGTDSWVNITVAEEDDNSLDLGTVDGDGAHTGAGASATFRVRDRRDSHTATFENNLYYFDHFQWRVTQERGSDTRKTPNGLPFVIRGYAFRDGRKRTPAEALKEIRRGR